LASVVPQAGIAHQDSGSLSGGGQRPSWRRRSDGGDFGSAGGGGGPLGPCFEQPVGRRGYAWWYVDGLSDDGRHGITIIAFIGSVFSPYYRWSRLHGNGDPYNHCSVNVALYGDKGAWAMTERGRGAVRREANWLAIGPSSLAWDGETLTIRIDEVTAPLPSRLRGTVRLRPSAMLDVTIPLDAKGRHRWSPIAAAARIDVSMDSPNLNWTGNGYFDSNDGDAALEDGFTSWTWSRAPYQDGAAIFYDVIRRDGSQYGVSILSDGAGKVHELAAPPIADLPKTLWRLPRATRADQGFSPSVLRRLVDAPFYSRSVLSTEVHGQPVTAVHESVSLDRFVTPWTQFCLPFRMPRALRSVTPARVAPAVQTGQSR
jgi:carotenoid 1,2-hydratase